MEVRNVMEAMVEGAIDEALGRDPASCDCERCRADMKAFALNNLPPRYIVDEPGVPHAYLDSIVTPLWGDVRYSVQWAIQMVSTHPRHARSLAGRRAPFDR